MEKAFETSNVTPEADDDQFVVKGVQQDSGSTECQADDDFDDFADFQEAQMTITNDNFTPFASNSSTSLPAQSSSTVNPLASLSTQSSETLLEANLENIIRDTFHKSSSNLSKETVISTDFFNGHSSLSRKLWDNLLNLDENTSLKLNWEASHTFQVFLKSLKIDPKSNDINHLVPTFASSLSLLEPTKSSLVSPIQSESKTNTNIEDSNQQNSASLTTAQSNNVVTDPSSIASETRPTNGLDIDYFFQSSTLATKNSKIPPKISSLENEFLYSETEDGQQPLSIISSSSTDPIHRLISQLHNSSDTSSPSPSSQKKADLTPEANQILDELPILNFMRSKVLMFPVHDRSKE